MGAVHPWPRAALIAWVSLVGAGWLAGIGRRQAPVSAAGGPGRSGSSSVWSSLFSPPALVVTACWLCAALWGAAQAVPLPPAAAKALARPGQTARDSVQEALAQAGTQGALDAGAPAPGAWRPVSVQPGATQRAAVMLAVYGVFFLSLLAGFRSRREMIVLSLAIAGTSLLLALQGTLQHLLSPSRIYGFFTSRYGGIHFGPFVSKNHFGGYLAMGGPVALGLALCAREWVYRLWRPGTGGGGEVAGRRALIWTSVAAPAAILAATALSGSRGAMLSLAVSLGFIVAMMLATAWQDRGWRLRAAGAMVLALVLLSAWHATRIVDPLTGQMRAASEDLRARAGLWARFARMAADFLPGGAGLGAFESVSPAYAPFRVYAMGGGAPAVTWYRNAENDYVETLAEMGPLGLGAMLGVIAAVTWAFARGRRRGRAQVRRVLLLGAFGGFLSITLHSFSDFNLRIPSNGLLAAALAALCLNLSASIARDTLPASKARSHESQMRRDQWRRRWRVARRALRTVAALRGFRAAAAAGLAALVWVGVKREMSQALRFRAMDAKPAEAERLLRRAAGLAWWDGDIWSELGQAQRAALRGETGLEAQGRAAWLAPMDGLARFRLGEALMASAKADAPRRAALARLAAGQFGEAARLSGPHFYILRAEAQAQLAAGLRPEALATLGRAVRDYPDQWDSVLALLGTGAEGLRAFRGLFSDTGADHLALGEFFLGRRMILLARDEFLRACETLPEDRPALRARCAERLAEAGAPAAALAALGRWIDRQPRALAFYRARAAIRERLGQWAEAAQDLQHAARQDPDSIADRLSLARCYERLEEPGLAEAVLQAALKVNPAAPGPQLALARFYARQKRLASAMAAYSALLDAYPDHMEALVELGDLYMASGQPNRALELFRRAQRAAGARAGLDERLAKAQRGVEAMTRIYDAPPEK